MTAITVANIDWEVVEDLHDALAAATINGETVFPLVSVTTSPEQAKEAQFSRAGPNAIIRYIGTTEGESPEAVRCCALSVELIIAAKVASASDETDRVKEVLRLVNAAKNAVEVSPPADAHAWGQIHAGSKSDYWHEKLQWGSPVLDTTERPPWVAAVIPLEISYTLANATSH
ncbi:MAG: hypothetical protein HQ546_01810 [Planctomycetes bacterium]|nr:hypothetical protein [Planctomycetota bacterium]